MKKRRKYMKVQLYQFWFSFFAVIIVKTTVKSEICIDFLFKVFLNVVKI